MSFRIMFTSWIAALVATAFALVYNYLWPIPKGRT